MKKKIILIVVSVALFLVAATLFYLAMNKEYTGKKGDARITLHIVGDKTVNASTVNAICQIIEERLRKSSHVEQFFIEKSAGDNRIVVVMPQPRQNASHVYSLLQSNGDLQIWETYDGQEIAPFIRDLMQAYADSVAGSLVSPDDSSLAAEMIREELDKQTMPGLRVMETHGIVGYASPSDTAAVNSMLQSPLAKNILPKPFRPLWGVKAGPVGNDEAFFLYAIKSYSGRPALGGDIITNAEAATNTIGSPCVSMTMNVMGAREWEELTRANIGHAIALTIDGGVYSAPVVNSAITGGKTEISGNFTPEETKDLAGVLSSGRLPARVTIEKVETIE